MIGTKKSQNGAEGIWRLTFAVTLFIASAASGALFSSLKFEWLVLIFCVSTGVLTLYSLRFVSRNAPLSRNVARLASVLALICAMWSLHVSSGWEGVLIAASIVFASTATFVGFGSRAPLRDLLFASLIGVSVPAIAEGGVYFRALLLERGIPFSLIASAVSMFGDRLSPQQFLLAVLLLVLSMMFLLWILISIFSGSILLLSSVYWYISKDDKEFRVRERRFSVVIMAWIWTVSTAGISAAARGEQLVTVSIALFSILLLPATFQFPRFERWVTAAKSWLKLQISTSARADKVAKTQEHDNDRDAR